MMIRKLTTPEVREIAKRRELVTHPFPRVNYYSGKTWAGCLIHERVATQGQRCWVHSTPWDEEWFAKFEEGK